MNEQEQRLREMMQSQSPTYLHLGCGGVHLKNHINIDFPQGDQPLVESAADVSLDIVKMDLPAESVDSIQIHHCFEHFSRGVALGLLINWHRWLKPGGKLTITVPDTEACCVGIASDRPLWQKMKLIRHIAGSHEEDKWSFHVDHWFEERLLHTLWEMGFGDFRIKKFARNNGVYDLEVKAKKVGIIPILVHIAKAEKLLRDSMLDPCEQPMLDIWKKKVEDTVSGE
jgi:predicted SAM-dependent methyltransferase